MMNGGGGGHGGNAGPIPPRWLHCPRKSVELIGGKFLAMKTPLGSRFDEQVAPENRFPVRMIFDAMESYKVKIGLWIDLCNTSRFYDRREVEEKGAKYYKLQCRGRAEAPTADQVDTFVNVCRRFAQLNPLEIIAVHCTHGFNRTGFLISSYLIETEDWSPEAAVTTFSKARPPGIYKSDYMEELFQRYGDVSDAPAVPDLPEWCYEDEESKDAPPVDDDGHQDDSGSSRGGGGGGRGRGGSKKEGVFMEGVPGVTNLTTQPILGNVRAKMAAMAGWRSKGFPGSQPVSMRRDNLHILSQQPYKVSWKADGMRYLMLIDGKSAIYFADRDNFIYKVEGLTFPDRKEAGKFLTDTMVDGEMVIDEVGSEKVPRYLIYDIVSFKGQEVGKCDFPRRELCIKKEIIDVRAKWIMEGKIDKASEPFSIRQKDFWDLKDARKILEPKFSSQLAHEPDGLIFQPFSAYLAGRDYNILKWKPASLNSVDFKLKIIQEDRPGMLRSLIGQLYVSGGHTQPVGQIRVTKELKQLNNKIIECSFDLEKNEWVFMRERTDKSFANSWKTAESVMVSIREPVTEQMLFDYIQNHAIHPRDPFRPPPPKMPRNH